MACQDADVAKAPQTSEISPTPESRLALTTNDNSNTPAAASH
jgi:hypothetical protein